MGVTDIWPVTRPVSVTVYHRLLFSTVIIMPKPRRDPLPPPPPPSTGILAGVFNFVAREFDSFVASATGSYPAVRFSCVCTHHWIKC